MRTRFIFNPAPVIPTEPAFSPSLMVGMVRKVSSSPLMRPMLACNCGAGTKGSLAPWGIINVPTTLPPLFKFIEGPGVSVPPIVGLSTSAGLVGSKLLDKPNLLTSNVLSFSGIIAPDRPNRSSKRPSFLLAAVLFQPEFRPVPIPLKKGFIYA